MSFKAREKERRCKIAMERDRKAQRGGTGSARHYLTLVSRNCCCNNPDCGRPLRRDAECVYRHEPREILCVACADRREIRYRPSARWEQANVTQSGKRRRKGGDQRPSTQAKRKTSSPRRTAAASAPTRAEIESARHTRDQLAAWGVKWPPRKGWRKRLLREADQRDGISPADPTSPTQPAVCSSDDRDDSRVCTGDYVAGELHRCWPEWTWDGAAFVRSDLADPTPTPDTDAHVGSP